MTSTSAATDATSGIGQEVLAETAAGGTVRRSLGYFFSGVANFLKLVLPFIVAIVLLAAVIWIWFTFPEQQTALKVVATLVAITGVFPVAYIASLGFRGESLRERLEVDFMLLGLVEEHNLKKTVNNLYRTVYNPTQYLAYISLIVLVCILVVAGFLESEKLVFMDPSTMKLVFYAFLGAYVFALQELVRRYNTFDLLPQVYSSILVRFIVSIVIVFVGSKIIESTGTSNLAGTSDLAGTNDLGNNAWAAIIAFVIGIFPKRGIEWFSRRTSTVLNSTARPDDERPLEHIVGISPMHAARLEEMGIDDAQNLATADIRRLLLTTQFDTQQIVSWIDQSILFTKVGRLLYRFRDSNVGTFHELRVLVDEIITRKILASNEQVTEMSESTTGLIALLGVSGLDDLARLTDYSNFPNYAHIAEYYSHIEEVTRQRATSATESLIGTVALTLAGSTEILSDRRLSDAELEKCYEDIKTLLLALRRDPNNTNYLLQLGVLYSCVGSDDEAEKSLSDAIKQDLNLVEAYHSRAMLYIKKEIFDLAIRDCSDAIRIEPTYAEAFNSRGFAYMKTEYYDRAIEDFNRALQLNDQLAKAYLNRGIVKNALSQFAGAKKDFETAYLLGYREASLWVSWATAHINQGEYQEAVDKLSQAVLFDHDVGVAYAKRGWAYYELGEDYYAQARNDLKTALRLDSSLPDAHNNLGLLEVAAGNVEQAVKHYKTALAKHSRTEFKEFEANVQSNLGDAYLLLGEMDEAKAAFEEVVKIAPVDVSLTVEAQKNLGLLADQEGQLDDAVQHFEAVLEETPEDHAIRYKLGRVYVRQKAWLAARREFEAIASVDQKKVEEEVLLNTYENLGAIELISGGYEDAMNCYLSALELNAGKDVLDDNVLRYNLALSYQRQGLVEPAAAEFQLVAESAQAGTQLRQSAFEHLQAIRQLLNPDGQMPNNTEEE